MSDERFTLELTRRQLAHLRDLMSVNMPGDDDNNLSKQLAALERRVKAEQELWNQLYKACELAGVEVGDEAPDFSMQAVEEPRMEVTRDE